MPDVTNGITRKLFSELVKGTTKFGEEGAVNYVYASVGVKGSAAVDNIGLPLMFDGTDSFIPFVINADWAATTAYVLGDIVKPATQDGFEYECIKAGTSVGAEPTFIAVEGATTVETNVTWIARQAYTGKKSTLPNKASVCVLVGSPGAIGLNQQDTTLTSTAQQMPVLFRGEAAVAEEGFEWGSIAAADQAEFYAAFEQVGIAVIDAGDTVDPVFV